MNVTEFTITAVKNLCRQEQEDWWAAVLASRVAQTALFSLREDQKTFENWALIAGYPGYDLNVVYGHDGGRLAYFWTCDRQGHGAFFHFNFLEAGLLFKMELGRYVLKVLAAAGYKCLASVTPVFNLHVVAYGEAMGGKVMGRWPGVCYVAAKDEWVDGILLQFLLHEEGA